SGTINHISLYNISTGKIEYTTEISKDWANIDKIEMNDNWILFRVVEDPVGAPVECFAINRKTNKISTVIPTNFNGNYVVVNNITLFNDDAFVSVDVFEKKGTAKEVFATGENLGEKLIKVNLKTLEASTVFDGTKEQMHISTLQSVKDGAVYLITPTPASKEKESILYFYKNGSLTKVSSHIVQLIDSFRGIKDEDAIIFMINSKDAYAYLPSLDAYKYVPINNYVVGATLGSKDYFVSESTEAYSGSSQPMPTNLYSKIFVSNRATSKVYTIRLDYTPYNLSIYGDEICFVEQVGDKDTIIYLDLKDNGF
ncbi:MAG: hypothetical protein ACP5GW_05050, partial [Caldisericaceae bacterium]